jgi:flagellin
MTVSTIASIAAGIGRNLGNSNAKVASSVKSLVTGSKANIDVASLSVSNSLQTQITTLRTATQNVAQASSLVRVAEGGASDIGKALSRLQQLSQQASSGSLSASERTALNIEFQALRTQINRIANNASFDGQKLLDGSLTSESLAITAEGEDGFSIASLTDEGLFGGQPLDLLSAENAQAASDAVKAASTIVSEQQAALGELGQGLEYAFASIQTASVNQDAARAVLSDTDFTSITTESQQAQVQAQATAALLAQTNKLPNNILALLTE